MRTEFETPSDNIFPSWNSDMANIRFALDQVDELIEAIHANQLNGRMAATNLQLATRTAQTIACTSTISETYAREGIDPFIEEHYEFWQYALAQCEKAREAFDFIIPEDNDDKALRIVAGQRRNVDDQTQFFRCVCTSKNIHTARKQDMGIYLDGDDDLPDFGNRDFGGGGRDSDGWGR